MSNAAHDNKRPSFSHPVLLRVSLTEKALLAKHLAVMLGSGLSIAEALEVSEDAARGSLAYILRGVSQSVRSGYPLSKALADYPRVFGGLFSNTVYAGEQSGTLAENLDNLAIQLEKERELVGKIRGAMMYPIIVLAAAFAVGLAIAFWVLPKVTPLFIGLRIDLPATTRALIWISGIVEQYGFFLLWGIVLVVLLTIVLVRQSFMRPLTHKLLLAVPLVKNVSLNANRARFARTLGMLLRSGVSIDEALEITKNTLENFYFRRALRRVADSVGRGSKLADSLARFPHLFPPLISHMVRVGEESGRFEETLFYLAQFYENEVENGTKALSNALEPLLLLVIGVVVGGLALSIITPIYEITGNIRR